MVRWVLNLLAGAGLAAALGYAWWSERHPPVAPPPASGSAATGSTAIAEPAPVADPHPAPLELFASSHVGDWYAYRVVNGGSLGEIRTTALTWIAEETPQQVTRTYRGRIDATGEERAGRAEHFPRAGLTLERLTGHDIGGWAISNVAVVDEDHAVGGRTFHCKKITFTPADPMLPRKRTVQELWVSSEVPAGGLVAQHEVQHLDDMTFDITLELTGFGDAKTTAWGTRPAGW